MVIPVTYSETFSVPGATLTLESLRSIAEAISRELTIWLPDLIRSREDELNTIDFENGLNVADSNEIQETLDLLNASHVNGCETSLNSVRLTTQSGGTHEFDFSQVENLQPHFFKNLTSAEVILTGNLGGYDNPRITLVLRDHSVHVSFNHFNGPLLSLTERVTEALESTITDEARLKLKLSDRIFLGHGGDGKWKTVESILKQGGYTVEAFETNDRTGSGTFFEVLKMIRSSRIAVVVMTGADELADTRRKLLARQNVVHEIGLAQGILGNENTIILMEDNVEEFSNIQGITQLRVPAGDLFSSKDQLLAAVETKLRD